MGDFNTNLLSTTANAKFVVSLPNDLAWKIVEHGATHHTGQSNSWIDVIFVNDNDHILSLGNHTASFLSHNNIIDVSMKVHTFKNTLSAFTYRDCKSIDPLNLMSISKTMIGRSLIARV